MNKLNEAANNAPCKTTSKPTSVDQQAVTEIIAYHQRSKHDFGHFAAGPDGLDWANQPDPFRRYHGAPLYPLAHPPSASSPSYGEISAEGGLPARPVDLASVSQLLFHSLALSAWKQSGSSRWALRVNPSSGNLHPTEGYLICAGMAGLSEQPGIYHYAPKAHALEHRATLPSPLWRALSTTPQAQRSADGDSASDAPADCILLALSSIPWREAWKYGQRAFRYCQHDVGHAIGAITVAAAGLGWQVRLLDGWGSDQLSTLLGLDGQRGDEVEYPDCLLAISRMPDEPAVSTPASTPDPAPDVPLAALQALYGDGDRDWHWYWHGQPNQLSPEHRVWPELEQAIVQTHKPATDGVYQRKRPSGTAIANQVAGPALATLVQQRRSAVAMDGHSAITKASFFHLLAKTLPAAGQVPFTALPWSPQVHLLLFVHRVQGQSPGVYLLLRDSDDRQHIQPLLRPEFEWHSVDDGPAGLYRLASGDARQLAQQLACTQQIAADGCFAVAMISRLRAPLQRHGAWFYPRLYWECGLIGQTLYLEATASGVAATGIGCFFDDPVHAMLGLQGDVYQSLYHFTIGRAVEDTRLSTLPPYADPEPQSPEQHKP